MKYRNRFVGGIVLLIVSGIIMVAVNTKASLPAAITLTIVGIALVATSRRGGSQG